MPSAIVAGAGVFGASLADRLSRSGWEVTLIDPEPPGHERSASGGESRLVRFAHGNERWYTRSAWRASALWRELEGDLGRELLVRSGVAWFAHGEGGWETDSEATLAAEGIPVERLDPADAGRLFPSIGVDDLAFVLLEPEAGVIRAREAVRALVERAVAHGTTVLRATARPDGPRALVDGRPLEADRVIWACGPWLPDLFPGLLDLRVTRQDVLFFEAGAGWRTPPVPGWVDYDLAFYGLGGLDGAGVKISPDHEGPSFHPDAHERAVSPHSERLARDYLRLRFPDLGDARGAGGRACPYSLTVDTNFVVAPHPEHDRVWLLGGGSGHGFKHGPALAEHVAGLLGGHETPDARFGIGPRRVDRSLRTAGGPPG